MRAFSAPGKAFIAGGYLVLDPKYKAFVIGLSARMHAVIQASPSPDGATSIVVKSPQFEAGEWVYKVDEEGNVCGAGDSRNPFVEATLRTVLNYVVERPPEQITVTIFSDDGYHSQDYSVGRKGRFSYHSKPINEVPKTGLGSSAALTTVLTTALLAHYHPETDVSQRADRMKIHNLAQIAHCSAQNKIGSGFDVASAVFGSLIYRRFPPELLKNLTGEITSSWTEYQAELRKIVNSQWEPLLLSPTSLNPAVSLLMGDICGGSETPKMVSKVLAWRKANEERVEALWGHLNASNLALIEALSRVPLDTSEVTQRIQDIRTDMRTMTEEANVPIEPPAQTILLDALTSEVDGVIGGVVPGAGGYDAICVLVDANKVDEVKRSTQASSSPVLRSVKWLDLAQDSKGIVEEDATGYLV
ncbi:phosphomevalonate kinase [Trichomonascus vanleenenianus]|uniref:phosphomevalonate kinase n=1 Tax=Trichomonascus vanleenenianus TaxID=2268995 RepID=UPI003ECA3849